MTGAQLHALLERSARQHGLPLRRFARPLSPGQIGTWLSQLREAKRPRPHTVQRVMALVEGRTPAPPPPESCGRLERPPVRRMNTAAAPAPDDAPTPIERDPCFKCGTRADIGCKHRRPA